MVVDGGRGSGAEPWRVPAKDADAGAVERRHPHSVGDAPADEAGHPLAHLVRRFIGEGDGEDGVRRDAVVTDEVGNPIGENPGLAGTSTGDNEHRPIDGGYRVALRRVQ